MPKYKGLPATDKISSNTPQTAERALALLGCFTLKEPELQAAQVATKMGWSVSTTYRYLVALESAGYLTRHTASGRFALGLKVIELAGVALSGSELRRHGQIEIERLGTRVNMNANLGILTEGDIFHLAFAVRTDEVDRMYAVIGRRTPAQCTSMGKAMLACLPSADVRQIINQYGWRPRSPHSIQDFPTLERALEEIRQVGFAVDRGEVHTQIWCVGAAVFDATDQVIGAISVSAPRERVEPQLVTVAREVIGHAERLALRLGYVGSHYRDAFADSERLLAQDGRSHE